MAHTSRESKIRAEIHAFLHARRETKLKGVKPGTDKYEEIIEEFRPETWTEQAARLVLGLQYATHTIKPVHPSARGTSIYIDPIEARDHGYVTSYDLPRGFEADVVGNTAALAVHKFLQIGIDGRKLLDLLIEGDQDAIRALSTDAERAEAWAENFVSVRQARLNPSSHALAKQVFWKVGSDPHDPEDFHLLMPLYPSALAHHVYQVIQASRFSDDAKAARAAKKAGHPHDSVVRNFNGTAVLKIGGSNPQNCGPLNSARSGRNILLPSFPPNYKASKENVTQTLPVGTQRCNHGGQEMNAFIVVPGIRVQNANCISSPLTWGFPSITAFVGFMTALARKLGPDFPVRFKGVGVICHRFKANTVEIKYEHYFTGEKPAATLLREAQNAQVGSLPPIVEKGTANFDISLVFGVDIVGSSKSEKELADIAEVVHQTIYGMRIAGGIITPRLESIGSNDSDTTCIIPFTDEQDCQKKWCETILNIPSGWSLVAREDLLEDHLACMKAADPDATRLDAWLDSVCTKHRFVPDQNKVKAGWKMDESKGWIVPIPVGYTGITEIYKPGVVTNARADDAACIFVDSAYTLGQWINPANNRIESILWRPEFEQINSIYICRNIS